MLCAAALLLVACGIADRYVQERGSAGDTSFGDGSGSDFGSGGAGSAASSFGMGGVSTAGTPLMGGKPSLGAASAGFGTGGKAIGFPPAGVCSLHVPDVPSCWGDGGAPALGGGGAPATGGAAADESWCRGGAAAAPVGAALLVDDFEDGDDLTPPFLNGRGAWFTANDGSGQQFPDPACAAALPSLVAGRSANGKYAMHTYGKGFTLSPGGYSLVGISAKAGEGCSQPVDASAFSGVQFTARGDGFVRFFMGTVETNPVADFGTCQAGCYDSHGFIVPLGPAWQTYRISFSQLVQEGWGAPAPFDPAHILTLQWSAKPAPGAPPPVTCFDFWIDDVSFYR